MSIISFNPGLFLGSHELNRFNNFLDDGFKNIIKSNAAKFGLIKTEPNVFINGYVFDDSNSKITFNKIEAFDKDGNFISCSAPISGITIPNDNQYYWVKVVFAYSSIELGVFSINSNGTLTCTSNNAELLKILRGQPDYSTKIRFVNSTNNLLHYDVIEVIDNNNAILAGNFVNESNLSLSVVGTYAPDFVPLASQTSIYYYNSGIVTLIQSTNRPTPYDGLNFYLARVKNNSGVLEIEDKREDIYQTNTDYKLNNLLNNINPLFGIDKINYDNLFSTKTNNLVYISWNYKITAWSFDSKLNIFTSSTGEGGRFKLNNISIYNNGDFGGWRLYTESGNSYRILTTNKQSSQINFILENPNVNDFINTNQTIIVCPDCESIEIEFTPNPNDSIPIAKQVFEFDILEKEGKCSIPVYKENLSNQTPYYSIRYRYRTFKQYTPYLTPLNDNIGYYSENSFDANGILSTAPLPIRTPYTVSQNAWLNLSLSPNSYYTLNSIDKPGIEFPLNSLNNDNPNYNLIVGKNTIYQTFAFSGTLNKDLNIILNQKLSDNKTLVKDGSKFILRLYTLSTLTFGSFRIRILQDTTTSGNSTNFLIFEIPLSLMNIINNQGNFLLIEFIFQKGTNAGDIWIMTNINNYSTI